MMTTTFFKSRDPGEGAGVGRGLNPHVVSRCAEPPTHKGRIYYPITNFTSVHEYIFPVELAEVSYAFKAAGWISARSSTSDGVCQTCEEKKKSECGCEEKQDILSDRACGTRRTASDMRLNYSSVAEGGTAV